MQKPSVLVQARPAAPAASSVPPMNMVRRMMPRPSVTREQVAQRSRSRCHLWRIMSGVLAGGDVLDDVLDVGFVRGLQVVVQPFLAVDLDLRIGGEVLEERGFGVGLALVLGGGLLEGRAFLLCRDRVAFQAAAF